MQQHTCNAFCFAAYRTGLHPFNVFSVSLELIIFFLIVYRALQVRAILIMLQGLEFVIQCAQITVVERFSKFGR